jgi:hypothetical protein
MQEIHAPTTKFLLEKHPNVNPKPPRKRKRSADESKPKAPCSYMIFCRAIRPRLYLEFPKHSNAEITKLLAIMWKQLHPDERQYYQTLAEEEKIKWTEENGPQLKKRKSESVQDRSPKQAEPAVYNTAAVQICNDVPDEVVSYASHASSEEPISSAEVEVASSCSSPQVVHSPPDGPVSDQPILGDIEVSIDVSIEVILFCRTRCAQPYRNLAPICRFLLKLYSFFAYQLTSIVFKAGRVR